MVYISTYYYYFFFWSLFQKNLTYKLDFGHTTVFGLFYHAFVIILNVVVISYSLQHLLCEPFHVVVLMWNK